MNQDTLWLQVPAAKVQPLTLVDLATIPDKLECIAMKLAMLQSCEYPYLDKINIILFIADHGVILENRDSLAQANTAALLNRFSSDMEL